MNSIHTQLQNDPDRILDRLVDGELSDTERRELLAALEESPGAWRRCALAFVESQILHEDLPALIASAKQSPAMNSPASAQRLRTVPRWGAALAMAASLVAAFALGTQSPEWGSWRTGAPGALVANSSVADNSAANNSPTRWHVMKVGNVEVPVVENSQFDPTWLQANMPTLSPAVLQSLAEQGVNVRTEARFLPVRSQDGREVIFPVQEVELTPASRQTF